MRIDLVAIAGIIGTLFGTIVGALVTLWVQKKQHEQEDRTRFHERRLAIYADFNHACNSVMAALGVGIRVDAIDMAKFLQSFETVRLVASQSVSDAATQVHTTVGEALRGRLQPNGQMFPTFNNEIATLCARMRTEVGIEAK